MTRTTNARIAGVTYLLYIAVAFPSMVLFGRATSGEGIAVKLAGIAQHATDVRVTVVLSLASCFAALVLAVTLYAITREQDPDLAMLGLTCRVAEGVTGAVSIPATLGLLRLATAAGPNAPETGAAQALAHVAANGRVRGAARAVADHEGRRPRAIDQDPVIQRKESRVPGSARQGERACSPCILDASIRVR
jgi:hypothetical protein